MPHSRAQRSVEEHVCRHSARLTLPGASSPHSMDLDTPRSVPMFWGHCHGMPHSANAAEGCPLTAKVFEGRAASRDAVEEHPASPPFPVNCRVWLSVAASCLLFFLSMSSGSRFSLLLKTLSQWIRVTPMTSFTLDHLCKDCAQ